jgi:hypothetical protein
MHADGEAVGIPAEPSSDEESESAGSGSQTYEIEDFVDARQVRGQVQLCIKWQGFPRSAENDVWRNINELWKDTPAVHNLIRRFVSAWNLQHARKDHLPAPAGHDLSKCQRKPTCVCQLPANRI